MENYGRHSQAAARAAKVFYVGLGPHFRMSLHESKWILQERGVPSKGNVTAWEDDYDVVLN